MNSSAAACTTQQTAQIKAESQETEKKEKITLFSGHNRLLRRQPGALEKRMTELAVSNRDRSLWKSAAQVGWST